MWPKRSHFPCKTFCYPVHPRTLAATAARRQIGANTQASCMRSEIITLINVWRRTLRRRMQTATTRCWRIDGWPDQLASISRGCGWSSAFLSKFNCASGLSSINAVLRPVDVAGNSRCIIGGMRCSRSSNAGRGESRAPAIGAETPEATEKGWRRCETSRRRRRLWGFASNTSTHNSNFDSFEIIKCLTCQTRIFEKKLQDIDYFVIIKYEMRQFRNCLERVVSCITRTVALVIKT